MILTNSELLEMDIQASYWRANLMHIYPKLGVAESIYSQEDIDPYRLSVIMEARRKIRNEKNT